MLIEIINILCYSWYDGESGFENKHDLPGSGKKLKEDLDNSDTQLLFNDIFLVRLENKKYIDFDVSDYIRTHFDLMFRHIPFYLTHSGLRTIHV